MQLHRFISWNLTESVHKTWTRPWRISPKSMRHLLFWKDCLSMEISLFISSCALSLWIVMFIFHSAVRQFICHENLTKKLPCQDYVTTYQRPINDRSIYINLKLNNLVGERDKSISNCTRKCPAALKYSGSSNEPETPLTRCECPVVTCSQC